MKDETKYIMELCKFQGNIAISSYASSLADNSHTFELDDKLEDASDQPYPPIKILDAIFEAGAEMINVSYDIFGHEGGESVSIYIIPIELLSKYHKTIIEGVEHGHAISYINMVFISMNSHEITLVWAGPK